MSDHILIFGGSRLQASIIKQSKRLGYSTILLDTDKHVFARNLADTFFQVAGDDYETTLNIARKYHVKALVTAATDHPLLMMSRIASELSLPFPAYESIDNVLDKWRFKQLLAHHNIPHAKGAIIDYNEDIYEIHRDFDFPVIIKPIKGSGSKGVYKCKDFNDIKNYINQSIGYSKEKRVLIEEYIEGDEISIEALVYENTVDIVQITDKIISPPPYNVEMGHIQPSKYANRKHEIQQLLQNIISVSGLNNCAIHPEVKINDKGIFIIELGPRLGGDYITSHLVPLSTGINMEEQLIKISIGKKPVYNFNERAAMILYFNFTDGEKLKKFNNKSNVNNDFYLEYDYELSKSINFDIIQSSFDRYGYIIIDGADKNELLTNKELVLKKAGI